MTTVLAIDQSTSATKALLFDDAGRPFDRESREHEQHYPEPGWVEHDAEEIWQNLLAVGETILGRHADNLDAIACLSLTNQRETIVVFDRATGEPLFPAIVWQCRRSAQICADHEAAGNDVLIHERTGLRLDAYFSGSKLQWLIENHADLRDKLSSGEALIGTIDAYLIYRLTGGRVFATDSTNASRTLLFNIGELRWDEELCELFKVPVAALPEVRESASQFGETDLGGALSKPIPIVGVMGDSQAALFAQRCFEPGTAKVTLGTGSSVLLNIGSNMKLSKTGVVTALAWVRNGKPVYAFEGIIINFAATLKWLQNQLELYHDVGELDRLSREVDDAGGVYLVPAFSGLGLPHWSAAARAAIVGLSDHSDRRHIARAAIESMAFQLRDALDAMQDESGIGLNLVKADGGPTGNDLLMQFTADLTRTELEVPDVPDCSPLGTVLMGLLGLGIHTSLESLVEPGFESRNYRPSMSLDDANIRHSGWQTAVRQVLAGVTEESSGETN